MGYAESIALASRLHRRAAAYGGRRRGGGECAARHFPLRGALSFFRPLHAFVALVAVLVLTSCGAGNGRFRIEGRFRNLNRGEFYVYSPDGGITGRDTIQVADGRFSYNVPLSGSATFVLIFPNFSQQVVFGENGAVVKISGDASHMKEMEITGTDANELMTEFRMAANRMSPPEEKAAVAGFVAENPASPASLYLITSRLLQTTSPDYAEAARLLRLVLKEDPTNGRVALLLKQVETLRPSTVGSRLPQFAATDTEATGPEELRDGYEIIREVSERTGVPVLYTSGKKRMLDLFLAEGHDPRYIGTPMYIDTYMARDWNSWIKSL